MLKIFQCISLILCLLSFQAVAMEEPSVKAGGSTALVRALPLKEEAVETPGLGLIPTDKGDEKRSAPKQAAPIQRAPLERLSPDVFRAVLLYVEPCELLIIARTSSMFNGATSKDEILWRQIYNLNYPHDALNRMELHDKAVATIRLHKAFDRLNDRNSPMDPDNPVKGYREAFKLFCQALDIWGRPLEWRECPMKYRRLVNYRHRSPYVGSIHLLAILMRNSSVANQALLEPDCPIEVLLDAPCFIDKFYQDALKKFEPTFKPLEKRYWEARLLAKRNRQEDINFGAVLDN